MFDFLAGAFPSWAQHMLSRATTASYPVCKGSTNARLQHNHCSPLLRSNAPARPRAHSACLKPAYKTASGGLGAPLSTEAPHPKKPCCRTEPWIVPGFAPHLRPATMRCTGSGMASQGPAVRDACPECIGDCSGLRTSPLLTPKALRCTPHTRVSRHGLRVHRDWQRWLNLLWNRHHHSLHPGANPEVYLTLCYWEGEFAGVPLHPNKSIAASTSTHGRGLATVPPHTATPLTVC